MRRRDVLAALGLAPLIARAQTPCPPNLTEIAGNAVSSTLAECQLVSADAWPTQGAIGTVPALRNRRGYAVNDIRHVFTALDSGGAAPTIHRFGTPGQSHAQANTALQAAIEATGDRLIIGERSGTYQLSHHTHIWGAGRVWFAGQTVPNPGITIRASRQILRQVAQGLFQHVRFHLTEDYKNRGGSGDVADAMIFGGVGSTRQRLVFQNCDFAFSFDELIDLNGHQSTDLDFIECGFLHPLDCPGLRETQQTHGFGPRMSGQFAGLSERSSFQGCFFAHLRNRVPRASLHQTLLANNLVYNWITRAVQLFTHPAMEGENMFASIIGNRYKHGPSGSNDPLQVQQATNPWGTGAGSRIYIADNSINGTIPADQFGGTLHNETIPAGKRSGTPQAIPAGWVGWSNGAAMESYILDHFGARPNNRNPLNTACRNNYVNGNGRVILTADATQGGCSPTGSPGSDVNLGQNVREFTAVADPWGNMTDPVDGKTRRKIEVQLLDMAGALQP